MANPSRCTPGTRWACATSDGECTHCAFARSQRAAIRLAREVQFGRVMHTPLNITFRGMTSSPSVEEAVRRWVGRLEQCCDRIQSCSVLVEKPHNHRARHNHFHVRIDVIVPGRQISVSRDPERDPRHEDVYVALADGFRAVRRRLNEHAHIRRDMPRRVA